MVLEAFFNKIFGSLIAWNNLYALIIISFILTLIITIIYKYLTDQNLIKQLKQESKELQQKAKDHKHDTQKMMEFQKQAMEKSMSLMKHSLKPTLITFIPLIIVFGWLRTTYNDIQLNFLGFINSWLWIYIISSIIFSIILRKILKIQ